MVVASGCPAGSVVLRLTGCIWGHWSGGVRAVIGLFRMGIVMPWGGWSGMVLGRVSGNCGVLSAARLLRFLRLRGGFVVVLSSWVSDAFQWFGAEVGLLRQFGAEYGRLPVVCAGVAGHVVFNAASVWFELDGLRFALDDPDSLAKYLNQ